MKSHRAAKPWWFIWIDLCDSRWSVDQQHGARWESRAGGCSAGLPQAIDRAMPSRMSCSEVTTLVMPASRCKR